MALKIKLVFSATRFLLDFSIVRYAIISENEVIELNKPIKALQFLLIYVVMFIGCILVARLLLGSIVDSRFIIGAFVIGICSWLLSLIIARLISKK